MEQPAKWLRWLFPKAAWRMDPKEKAVYLTFDDGPIPEATPFILKTLEEYGVKATFFMVGDNVREYPDLYRQIVEAGHQVGNHTFHHLEERSSAPNKNVLDDTRKTCKRDLFMPAILDHRMVA